MAEEILKRFGNKYVLLNRIATGGMAEIFLACEDMKIGEPRIVAIKRISSEFAENSEFLSMFRSEIKVMQHLSHPNIVHLKLLDEVDGQNFIVMEHIDGRNVRQILGRLVELGQRMPVPLAVYLIEQAARGLDYAHHFKHPVTKEHLQIVHRDISPQNIMVAYDGSVKVIDFGIAKAIDNPDHTRAGVIKGKLSYLSPEQVLGQPLDRSTDIFSLGIVLWELLTGRKLFQAQGDNDYAVFKLIETCDTSVKPPSTLNADVSPALSSIVLNALAKSKKKRFQTCEEFAKELKKYLFTEGSEVDSNDLSRFISGLFEREMREDHLDRKRLMARADALMHQQDASPNSSTPQSSSLPGKIPQIQRPMDLSSSALRPRIESGQNRTRSHHPPTSPSLVLQKKAIKSRSIWPWAMALFGILGGVYWTKIRSSQVTNTSSSANHERAPGSISGTQKSVDRLTDRPLPPGKTWLKLVLTPNAPGGAIQINGKRIDIANPIAEVAMDDSLELVIEKPGFRTIRRQFAITKNSLNGKNFYQLSIQLEAIKYGFLTIHTRPAALALIRSSNRDDVITLRTPFENEKFPTGTYQVLLENRELGLKRSLIVTVEEGKSRFVNERLEATP